MKIQLLIALFSMVFPISFANSMDTDVKVDIPIEELKALLQQLDDISDDLVGQAGIQMRQTIDELNDKVTQQIGNIKDAASDIIQEAATQLRAIVKELIEEANKLLETVNRMINEKIDCINKALAERIGQIKDSVIELLDKATEAIQNAVDRIYFRANQLIETGTSKIAVIMDKTLANAIRIGLGVAIFILLFWLLRTLFKFDRTAKNKTLKYVIMGVSVALIGLFAYALFTPRAIAKIAGHEVNIPKWEKSCDDGNKYYDQFMDLVNAGADKAELKRVGDLALESLNWCLLTSMSPEIGRGTSERISEIAALLYPAPAAPSAPGSAPVVTCGGTGTSGGAAVAVGWVSKYDLGKLAVYEKLQVKKVKIPDVIGPKVNPAETMLTTYVADVNKKVYPVENTLKVDAVLDQRIMDFKYKETPSRIEINRLRGIR